MENPLGVCDLKKEITFNANLATIGYNSLNGHTLSRIDVPECPSSGENTFHQKKMRFYHENKHFQGLGVFALTFQNKCSCPCRSSVNVFVRLKQFRVKDNPQINLAIFAGIICVVKQHQILRFVLANTFSRLLKSMCNYLF